MASPASSSSATLMRIPMDPPRLSVLQPPDEFQPRPHVVHRTHLHVHEPMSECDAADHIFGEIRGQARPLLGPGEPRPPGGSESGLQVEEPALELPPPGREALD